MRRSATEANLTAVPNCGTHVTAPHNGVKGATGTTVGVENVVFAGVAKSTWNLNKFRLRPSWPKDTMKLGEPGGGAIVPSISAGSSPETEVPCCMHDIAAGCPASMAARSYAHGAAPNGARVIGSAMVKVT